MCKFRKTNIYGDNGNLNNDELWSKLDERMKDETLNEWTKVSLELTKSLYNDMNEMQSTFSNYKYKSTFWGLFAVIGDFLQVTSTLIVIFTSLTYTRLFGRLGLGVIVIRPQPIEALSIIPQNNTPTKNKY